MKHFWILVILFVCTSVNVNGQELTDEEIKHEFILELGQSNILGDFESRYFAGQAFAINYNYLLTDHFYIGVNYGLRSSKGLGHQPIIFQDVDWFPSYKTRSHNVNFKMGYNSKSWNGFKYQIGLGVGLFLSETSFDALDENGLAYQNILGESGYTNGAENYLTNVNSIYDQVYETESSKQVGLFRINETVFYGNGFFEFKVYKQITSRLSLGIGHTSIYTQNDYLEGFKMRTSTDQRNSNDFINSQTLVLKLSL